MKRISMIALAALAACGQQADNQPEAIRAVRVITVGAENAIRSVEYAGEVRARHEIGLGFRVGGKILARMVDVGAAVHPGEPLARLDPTDLALASAAARAQEAAARSQRDLARADLARYQGLRAKHFISQAEYDRRANALATTESALEAARAQARQAANQARYAILEADSAGVVTAVQADAGQVVAAGQPVVTIARPDEKEIAFAVPEAQRSLVEAVDRLEVTLSALPGRSWAGKLRELSPAADPVTRTYAARAALLDPPGDEVALGMSARVRASVGGPTARIELPISALYARGDAPQVFLVDGQGTARLRTVETGGVSAQRVVIEAGLEKGDVVVVAGASLLRSGQRVRVLEPGDRAQ